MSKLRLSVVAAIAATSFACGGEDARPGASVSLAVNGITSTTDSLSGQFPLRDVFLAVDLTVRGDPALERSVPVTAPQFSLVLADRTLLQSRLLPTAPGACLGDESVIANGTLRCSVYFDVAMSARFQAVRFLDPAFPDDPVEAPTPIMDLLTDGGTPMDGGVDGGQPHPWLACADGPSAECSPIAFPDEGCICALDCARPEDCAVPELEFYGFNCFVEAGWCFLVCRNSDDCPAGMVCANEAQAPPGCVVPF